MKQLTILVPDGENNISSIAGAYKILPGLMRYGNKNMVRSYLKYSWRVFQRK
jgi:hypothetical protein